KADLLVFGMGERPLLELVRRLESGENFQSITDLKGTAVVSRKEEDLAGAVAIPSFEEVSADKKLYAEAFRLTSQEQNPFSGKVLIQPHGDRFLFCNPPALPLPETEMDRIYSLPFTRLPHLSYKELIPAWEQIKTSITTHRGCAGGCAFCAITSHQGKFIQSRSEKSVLAEIERVAGERWSHGCISDIGGPTANMYGASCTAPDRGHSCRRGSCLYPAICRHLDLADARGAGLLRKARSVKGVKHTAVSSGVRFDLLLRQKGYFDELAAHQVGGLLKVAPEHLSDSVTKVMRKPGGKAFAEFLEMFRSKSREAGKRQAVVPYLISGHPGCTLSDMVDLALKLQELGLKVEQVQDFTPTPGTLSTCIYHTGLDPFTGESVYVPRGEKEKKLQKSLLLAHLPENRKSVLEALRLCGREGETGRLLGAVSGKTAGGDRADRQIVTRRNR